MSSGKPSEFPNMALDYTIGCILAIVFLAGTLMNVVAFSYYRRDRTRKRNSEFFRRLFSIITANDIIICLSVFPVVDAAFSKERKGYLFGQKPFCRGWFVIWHMAWQMSMTTVAMLSLSRLLVIKYANSCLRPWITYAFLGLFSLCILIYWAITIGLDMVFPTYYQNYLYCGVSLFRDLSDKIDPPFTFQNNKRFVIRKGVISITTLFIIISFLIVITSFIMSLFYLNSSKKAARNLGSSSSRQYAAAKTVIIFTFMAIVASTPIMMVALYTVINEIFNPLKEGSTGADIMNRFAFNGNRVLEHYAWPVSMILTTCLNSTINPLIYYWRMRGFRNFVDGIVKQSAASLRHKLRGIPVDTEESSAYKKICKLAIALSNPHAEKENEDNNVSEAQPVEE